MSIFPMSTLGPLGAQRSRRTPWWLSGGVSSANCVATYQPKGAASLAASYTNLANVGTYTAAPGVAPTWDAVNGWIFNGTTQYLTTGIVPDVVGQAWSVIVRFSSCISGVLVGINGTNKRFFIYNISTVNYSNGSISANSASGDLLSSGVLGIAGKSCYRNGSFQSTIPTSPGDANTIGLFIGASNNGSSANTFCLGNIQAISIYNTTPSAAQVLAVTTAMNAL